MRYQLPDGMDSISVCGQEFKPDEDGVIDVPPEVGAEVHMTLQSPHHFGLKVIEEEIVSVAERAIAGIANVVHAVETVLSPREEKKRIRDLLSAKGIREDGRATLAYLRRRLAEVMGSDAEQAQQPDPAAAAAPNASAPVVQQSATPESPEPPASPPAPPPAAPGA